MARNFSNMTKEELHEVVNSSDFKEMSLTELSSLRKDANAAGILDGYDGDKIAMLINNKTYDAIKADDKNYTPEEKALAKSARDEYNDEIRGNRAKEILKRAQMVDGKYVFDALTKGEMDLLLKSGIVSFNDMKISQEEYKIGQENKANIANILQALQKNAEKRETLAAAKPQGKPAEAKVESKTKNKVAPVVVNEGATPAMPADLQKSYDFWSKFNENSEKTGVKYQIDNIEDKHLLVEAKKGDKTIFQGIDHGSKGFDIVKRDKDADAYEMFDMLVKKVKARNPKTVIRIKDNVTDDVLRNKILIACAKNNMKPVGNLPEGFDFEALKEQVKNLKTTEEINALAESMHLDSEYAFGEVNTDANANANVNANANANSQQRREKRSAVGFVVNNGNNGNGGNNNSPTPPLNNGNNNGGGNPPVPPSNDDKDDKKVGGVIFTGGNGGNNNPPTPPSNNGNNNGGNNPPIIPIVPTNGGNGGNSNPPANGGNTPSQKKSFWTGVKHAAITAAIFTAGLFMGKSCENKKLTEANNKAQTELTQKNDSLQNEINKRNAIITDLGKELDDCNESKKPKPAPVRKPTKRKPIVTKPTVTKPVQTTPIQTTPVQTTPVQTTPVQTTPTQKTPERDTSRDIDTGNRHSQDGVRSTPSSRDAKDAADGVVDFGDRHGIHDNLSSDVSNGLSGSVTPKSNTSDTSNVGTGDRDINFYDALAFYNKSKGNNK